MVLAKIMGGEAQHADEHSRRGRVVNFRASCLWDRQTRQTAGANPAAILGKIRKHRKGERIMLADGAHLKVSADRALETVLGGKESPAEDERMSALEFAVWIRTAPLESDEARDYGEAARCYAKLYLMAFEADCKGEARDVWREAETRWPDLAKRCEGGTGFMHGWAFNAARNVLHMPPVQNPALLEIEIGE